MVREGKNDLFPKKKRNRMKGMGDNGEKLGESKVGTVSPIRLRYGEIWPITCKNNITSLL